MSTSKFIITVKIIMKLDHRLYGANVRMDFHIYYDIIIRPTRVF